MRNLILMLMLAFAAAAQSTADRVLGALEDRALSEQVARLTTDDRIAMYATMSQTRPENAHYQVLLASAYVQKTRETTDYSYLDRAASLLSNALTADSSNYEALRLMTQTQLERHQFAEAAESSRRLIRIAPADPWNWGTLGDALTEIGDYDAAGDAYQKMVTLRPDLASYNRAAHFRFLYGDVNGAIEIMQRAIDSGSSAPENVAWCMVDLGNIYFKTSQPEDARKAFENALRIFPNYHPAYAGLARVMAQTGHVKEAIENFRRAQQITPMPDYAAALFDLYSRTHQDAEAKKQKEMIEVADAVSTAAGERANRNLVLIFADHNWHLNRALELARNELEFRRDVYSYDALAWALYKNGRYAEAREASQKAVKLGTPEPLFREHARVIGEAK